MRKNLLLSMVILAAIVVGCAKTDSSNIKTSGFYADYAVKTLATSPSVATCTATFRVEAGGTYIDLSSGDTVTCNGQSMARSELFGIVTYSANLTATVGATYTIVLTRSGEVPYSASVTLPEAVSPTSPANNASGAKGSVLNFSWTTSSSSTDAMTVSASSVTSGDNKCPTMAYFQDSAPENGVGSFSASEMSLPATGIAGACSMNITWQRRRPGIMPSGLKGDISGVQEATRAITLN